MATSHHQPTNGKMTQTTTKPSHAITNAWAHYDGWRLAFELFSLADSDRDTESKLGRATQICDWLGINPAQRLADLSDVASDYIRESALSAEVRSGWQSICTSQMVAEQWRMVFSTGGPHLELKGEFDHCKSPCSFEVHASDWSEHHELTTDKHGEQFDEEVLQWVASCIYWGE